MSEARRRRDEARQLVANQENPSEKRKAQKIQSKGYVVKDKKTGQLTPTNKAYLLINYLYDNEFSDPETTGGWEMFLSQIGEGTINPREFVDAIKDKLTLQIKEVKERGD